MSVPRVYDPPVARDIGETGLICPSCGHIFDRYNLVNRHIYIDAVERSVITAHPTLAPPQIEHLMDRECIRALQNVQGPFVFDERRILLRDRMVWMLERPPLTPEHHDEYIAFARRKLHEDLVQK